METPRFRNDIGLFFLLTLAALIRNCFYLTEMHALYYTVHCGHITNLIRVLGNHSMFLERSLARNLVFETFRGLFRPIAYGLLYEGRVDWKFVSEMAVTTVLFICLVTLFVPKSTFKKHNVAWAYTNMEFFLMFADGFIYAMNKIEMDARRPSFQRLECAWWHFPQLELLRLLTCAISRYVCSPIS
ncbi:UNKNOWN [Stylonychia lemnae]|uniref:Uncharacterized protein n=1 Tax=Stylonychia lemnae TaxID=5949 RepID=A0A078AIF9_STYLE|nr:UNKNOWN [Stylonychia lemnae]|eukprot:CDW82035.1 UNKNOWN [Stylonychia lemnae]